MSPLPRALQGRVAKPRPALAACLCLALGAASAQTVAATAAGCVAAPPATCGASLGVTWRGVRVGGTTVGLELATSGLGLSLSAAEAFGPLGNVVFELGGELRQGPVARASLGARGVIASVAARLAVAATGADAERFDPLAVAAEDPLLGGPRLSLAAGGTFRLDRRVVLDVSPSLHLAPGGASATGSATLRVVRALGENELQARLSFALLPGPGDHAALGAALVLPRGRAPDWRFTAWLGYGENGPSPGASLEVDESLGELGVTLSASFEPYRRDARPLRGAASVELPLGGPTALLELAAGALHPTAPDALAGRLSVVWPFGR
jgi:hypothetical protein